jgi:16S rRNA (uracil1498-N3)-methyltransferase
VTHRFFVPQNQVSGTTISITGGDVDHIRRVLRLKEGDEIDVLDGTGRVYAAKIREIKGKEVICEVITSRSAKSEPETKVTLIQSIPREQKMDILIQKCTELGVDRIIPAMSERTIIKLDEKKKASRISRWGRIAKEAAEQSARGMIPRIDEVQSLDEALKSSKDFDLCLIPWEMEEKATLKEVLRENHGAKSVLIAIGPEGGFSKAEVDLAINAGFKPVSLGKRILRTETAGIAVLAMVNYEFEM